jgi:DNA-directed RNA polymerase subunit RPC12/RpoP
VYPDSPKGVVMPNRTAGDPPVCGGWGQYYPYPIYYNDQQWKYEIPQDVYKCPKCKGEFNRWDYRVVEDRYVETCPFCSSVKGEYK